MRGFWGLKYCKMKISVLLTTVNHTKKQLWLPQVIESIDKLNLDFDKKIVSVDTICDDQFDPALIAYLERKDWVIKFSTHKSRLNTLTEELQSLQDNDFILHAEDDIAITWLPEQKVIEEILKKSLNERKCGILTPSLGGSTFKCEGGDNGDFDLFKDKNNIILNHPNYIVFQRKEENRSLYFFELGTIFVDPKIFLKCLNYSRYYPGMQIEQAISLAWFNLGIHQNTFKATICKPHISVIYERYPELADPTCRFIEILDPNQGSSLYGGEHHISTTNS